MNQLENELESRRRGDRIGYTALVLSLLFFLVSVGIFAVRVTPVQVDGGTSSDPTSISFTRSHVDWLNENHNESVENGFCLFGHIKGGEVVVEEVEFVNNPLHQEKGAMSFTCIPQIFAYSSSLVAREEYRLVGVIHTHPESAYLSREDRDTFQAFDPILSTFGVFNGERLRMYSDPVKDKAITSVLRYE